MCIRPMLEESVQSKPATNGWLVMCRWSRGRAERGSSACPFFVHNSPPPLEKLFLLSRVVHTQAGDV